MTDPLLFLKKVPYAEKLLKASGLPVSVPALLERDNSARRAQPLAHRKIRIGHAGVSKNGIVAMQESLQKSGAQCLTGQDGTEKVDGICFDASHATNVQELADLHSFFQANLGTLKTSAHVLLIGRDPKLTESASHAAAQRGLTGFVKSLAKELGRKGVTVNVMYLPNTGALTTSGAALEFFLSPRSAFITGQAVTWNEKAGGIDAERIGEQPLRGKVALVTGAAQGIGASIAKTLAREGATVYGLDRPAVKAELDALMESIGGHGVSSDLTDANVVDTVLHALQGNGDKLDILVNNAGITRDKTLARMSAEQWQMTLTVNLGAALSLSETLAEKVLRPGGRIIFMTSVNGIAGAAGQTNYATAKAGLIGATEVLSQSLVAKKLAVFALAPGFIETKMTQAMPLMIREVARRFNALNQGGVTEDVAEAVAFFASTGSSGLSGTVLRVCGLNQVGA